MVQYELSDGLAPHIQSKNHFLVKRDHGGGGGHHHHHHDSDDLDSEESHISALMSRVNEFDLGSVHHSVSYISEMGWGIFEEALIGLS